MGQSPWSEQCLMLWKMVWIQLMSRGREWKVPDTDLYFHIKSGDLVPWPPQGVRGVCMFLHDTNPVFPEPGHSAVPDKTGDKNAAPRSPDDAGKDSPSIQCGRDQGGGVLDCHNAKALRRDPKPLKMAPGPSKWRPAPQVSRQGPFLSEPSTQAACGTDCKCAPAQSALCSWGAVCWGCLRPSLGSIHEMQKWRHEL